MKFYEIEQRKEAVIAAKKAYLRRFGWTETCSTPGAFWLWKRDFKNEDVKRLKNFHINFPDYDSTKRPNPPHIFGQIMVGLSMAVSITSRELDQDPYGELEE